MRFTLRQIEVFLETARTGSLSRAADKLSMSQSAASSALKDLESHYNAPLFDRIGKRLKINALGASLQAPAEAFIEQGEQLEQLLNGVTGPGKLAVGATLTIGTTLAIELIARFKERFPGADLQLSVANTQTIADRLLRYELDVGLIEGELHHKDLLIHPWIDDELTIFASPDHPAASLTALDDQALLAAPWIVRERGSGTRQTFERAMTGLLPSLHISLELEHTDAIKRAVQSGLGLGCLSRVSLQDDIAQGNLVPLRAPGRDLRRHFSLILHRDKFRSAALTEWLSLCEHAAQTALKS